MFGIEPDTLNLIVASAIFAISFIGIMTERVHRAIVALCGAGLMVAAGLMLGFYDQRKAFLAIDFETLALLFGMMMLVVLLQPTGFFEYLAIKVGHWSGGRPVRLLVLLGSVTTVLSMFLDNVTTVMLIAPVTVLICEILMVSPAPYLIAEAILSNTGGVATLVGDPPNVLIGSAVPLTFVDFLKYSLPVVVVAWVLVLLLLLYLSRKELVAPEDAGARIKRLNPSEALLDPENARKVVIVLCITILLFFVHHLLHLSPGFIALGAASTALLWVRPKDFPERLEKIEWSVLIFFAALFVLIGGLEFAGLLELIAEMIARASGANPIALGIALIWSVALLSAVIDNIPITIALIPVIQSLGNTGIDIAPLWWALVFGAGFGGNGTVVGSTANIIVVSLSERTRAPITTRMWVSRGMPALVVACTVASIFYAAFFSFFSN